MRLIGFIYFVGLFTFCFGQKKERTELDLGIKTSINISSILGTEFQNAKPKFGYTAGAYLTTPLKKKWSLQTETLGSFRGSSFNNGDTGYSKIALFYVDLLVAPTYALEKNSITIGPYLSYFALGSIYIGAKKKAEDIEEFGIKPLDFGIAGYYTVNGPIVGFQFGAKVGLSNVNNGVNFDGIFPETGNGGTIKNLSFEIGMLF